jgi:hypothetical protein
LELFSRTASGESEFFTFKTAKRTLEHSGDVMRPKVSCRDGLASPENLGAYVLKMLLWHHFLMWCRRSSSQFGVLLGDLPLLTSNDIGSILDAFSRKPSGKTAVVPESDNRFGHPCFFDPLWLRRFRSAEGDVGGRVVIRSHLDEVQLVKARKGCFIDMDTPEDYEKIQKIRADMKEGE